MHPDVLAEYVVVWCVCVCVCVCVFIQSNPVLEPFDLPNLVSIGGGLFIWVIYFVLLSYKNSCLNSASLFTNRTTVYSRKLALMVLQGLALPFP